LRRWRSPENVLRASDTAWCIIRPSRLADRPRRTYRSRREGSLRFGIFASRAGTAAALLDALEQEESIGATIAVAN
jgi:hypothetical protein